MVQLLHGLIPDKTPPLSIQRASIHAHSAYRPDERKNVNAYHMSYRHFDVTFLVMSGILSTKSPKNMTFSSTLPNSEEEMGSEVNNTSIVQFLAHLLESPDPREMVDLEKSLGQTTFSRNPEQPVIQLVMWGQRSTAASAHRE